MLKIFNVISDIGITTDRKYPSIVAHQVTLTLEDAEPIAIQVPWPVAVDDIAVTIIERNNDPAIRLIMKKSLNAPFPCEFGHSQLLVVDDLKPWKDLGTNGNLKTHIDAQFCCQYLMR